MKGGLVRVSLRAGLCGTVEALTKRRLSSRHLEFVAYPIGRQAFPFFPCNLEFEAWNLGL